MNEATAMFLAIFIFGSACAALGFVIGRIKGIEEAIERINCENDD